jgi:3-hydroxyisobutyrate dehydrogenase-like beta-hydroxyacid dehydrogenase
MANLGFIGLGVMGGRIAARLMEKGHTVTGYARARDRAQWLVEKGLRWADSSGAVAAAADITFVMVNDSAALESVARSGDGLLTGLSRGKVVVDMSTVSPDLSRAVAEEVRARGADMVDAPVSGSVATLEQGKLSVMVGGHRDTFERLKPLLEEIGPTVTHIGGNGLALAMKIAINLSVGVQMQAFSEGLLLAEKSGIDRRTAVEVMTHSAIASPVLQYRGPLALGLPAEPWFNVNMMQKDMLLALELGRRLGVPLPTSSVTNEFLTAARAAGFGEQDCAAVFQSLAALSGVKA